MKFKKGQSGNPAGRPKGLLNHSKLRALLEPDAKCLIEKAVAMAKRGNVAALRLCLERIIPPLKADTEPARIAIDMSGTPADQGRAVLVAVTEGKISVDSAAQLLQGIAASMKIIEVSDLAERIATLERRNDGPQ